jgi:hypothetical protein
MRITTPGFPLEAVISEMTTIMRNNIFEFGDCYFLQLLGTAMGTSAAVMWATIYYTYHEVHTIIPNHGSSLLYYRRFIARGWERDVIRPVILTAYDSAKRQLSSVNSTPASVQP